MRIETHTKNVIFGFSLKSIAYGADFGKGLRQNAELIDGIENATQPLEGVNGGLVKLSTGRYTNLKGYILKTILKTFLTVNLSISLVFSVSKGHNSLNRMIFIYQSRSNVH